MSDHRIFDNWIIRDSTMKRKYFFLIVFVVLVCTSIVALWSNRESVKLSLGRKMLKYCMKNFKILKSGTRKKNMNL